MGKLILDLIAANPAITQKELAARMSLTEDGVYYHISKLKAQGVLEWVGGKKARRWKVAKRSIPLSKLSENSLRQVMTLPVRLNRSTLGENLGDVKTWGTSIRP